jgi:hypothetical protein
VFGVHFNPSLHLRQPQNHLQETRHHYIGLSRSYTTQESSGWNFHIPAVLFPASQWHSGKMPRTVFLNLTTPNTLSANSSFPSLTRLAIALERRLFLRMPSRNSTLLFRCVPSERLLFSPLPEQFKAIDLFFAQSQISKSDNSRSPSSCH